MRLKRILVVGMIIVLFAIESSFAEAPISQFHVLGEAMKKIASETIGFLALSPFDFGRGPLVVYSDYKVIGQKDEEKEVSIKEFVPFCRYGYRSDSLTSGAIDFPVIALRGQSAEIIYNAQTGNRGWVYLPKIPTQYDPEL